MRKVPIIMQMQQNECGICCINMILKFYQSHESIQEIRNELEVGRDGLSLLRIQNYFESKNFDVHISKTNFCNIEIQKLPAILFWENKHFVVLENVIKDTIYILDPAIGRQKLTKSEFNQKFSDYIIYLSPNENFTKYPKNHKNVWFSVLKLLPQNLNIIIHILIITLFSYSLTLAQPIFVQKVIDMVIATRSMNFILISLAIAIVIVVCSTLSFILQGLRTLSLSIILSKELDAAVFKHLTKLPFKFFSGRMIGDLIQRLNGLSTIRDLLSSKLITGLLDIGTMIIIFIYMLSKSYMISLIALCFFIVDIIILVFSRKKLDGAYSAETTQHSKLSSIQIELLNSMQNIKVNGLEEDFYNDWESNFKKMLEKYEVRSKVQIGFSGFVNAIQSMAPLIILILGLVSVIDNELTLGEAIAFQTISSTFFGLSTSIFACFNQIIIGTTLLKRIEDITKQEVKEQPSNAIKIELTGNVKVENITFSYTKYSKEVLKNVSFEISSGQKIGIVGKSGMGKSTIVNLLTGLYDVNSGVIMFDGIPIHKIDRKFFYGQIGVIPQDIQLFNKTILENIVLNNKTTTLNEVIEITQITYLHDEISEMPMGYNTVVSEMGNNLSRGQRQRILLARAMVRKPKVLILDEATSALDSLNEKLITDYLEQIGCTIIVVAHRLSTIIDSDLILVLDDGVIVERGSHEELMNTNGVYKSLYNL